MSNECFNVIWQHDNAYEYSCAMWRESLLMSGDEDLLMGQLVFGVASSIYQAF
jgi:hypothetical protein